MKNTAFTSIVSNKVELADRFAMDNAEFAKHIKHLMLTARTKRDVWNQELELRALHGASFKYWSSRSRQMFMNICKEALDATDHMALCKVFAARLPEIEVEYDAFSKKQAGLFTALGASSDLSSFLALPVRTAVGSVSFISFDKKTLVEYLVGAGQFDKDTRFNHDDAKACADWQTANVEMAAIRSLFMEHELGRETWDRVYTGRFTKERRKALMEMGDFTTRINNNEWDAKVAHLSEQLQRNISNGEVHHLLSALLKQFDFLSELRSRTTERALEQKVNELKALHSGSSDSVATWELGKDDFLGEEMGKGMAEMQEEFDDLTNYISQVINMLHAANEVFKPVHGPLAYLHIRKGDEYIKVDSQTQARMLRKMAWDAKIDERNVLEWETLSTERLAAIDEAMKKSYI